MVFDLVDRLLEYVRSPFTFLVFWGLFIALSIPGLFSGVFIGVASGLLFLVLGTLAAVLIARYENN